MAEKKHRTVPLADSITHIRGYPTKLTLYQIEASPYWWVRYYIDGRIIKRTTRTTSKREAIEFAKRFYDEINLKRAQGQSPVFQTSFASAASNMLKSMTAQLERGEIVKQTVDMATYRINKSILPFFGSKDVNSIYYEDLERYLSAISKKELQLSPSTISTYMKLVRKVLTYSYKQRILKTMPHFPSVRTETNARGYFNSDEYRKLWNRARALIGKRFEYRKLADKSGNELPGTYFPEGKTKDGRLIRKIEITQELVELIIFMVNSFIRPTDIKNLKHKHVDIIDGESKYLRLNLPKSKKHDKPIVTLAMAVEVYKRLTKHNADFKRGISDEDYVFYPNYPKRDYALKLLQRQFDVLMWNLGMDTDLHGNPRTIYSLRHTCIMLRLTESEGMDLLTLARNARTSPEMIDKHYASQLAGEQNIEMLQSKRRKPFKE